MKDARAFALAGAMIVSCAASAEAGGQLSGRDLMRLFPGRFQAVVNGAMEQHPRHWSVSAPILGSGERALAFVAGIQG